MNINPSLCSRSQCVFAVFYILHNSEWVFTQFHSQRRRRLSGGNSSGEPPPNTPNNRVRVRLLFWKIMPLLAAPASTTEWFFLLLFVRRRCRRPPRRQGQRYSSQSVHFACKPDCTQWSHCARAVVELVVL